MKHDKRLIGKTKGFQNLTIYNSDNLQLLQFPILTISESDNLLFTLEVTFFCPTLEIIATDLAKPSITRSALISHEEYDL